MTMTRTKFPCTTTPARAEANRGDGTHKLFDDFVDEVESPLSLRCCVLLTCVVLGMVVMWLVLPVSSFSYAPTTQDSGATGATGDEIVVISFVIHQVDWSA